MVSDVGGSGPPADYHDYVFRDGRLVGAFDEMYRHAKEIPWHQDNVRERLDCRIAVEFLRYFGPFGSVLEVGCGLGYFADMLAMELRPRALLGMDVSAEAVKRARERFQHLAFDVVDLCVPGAGAGRGFDLVVVRGFFWYVFPRLETVIRNLTELTAPGGRLFVAQNFPPLASAFVGKELIPNPDSLIARFAVSFRMVATLSLDSPTVDANDNWIMFVAVKR